MTVAELMEHLKELPEDAEVFVANTLGTSGEMDSVELFGGNEVWVYKKD